MIPVIFKVENGNILPLPKYLNQYNDFLKNNEGKLVKGNLSKVYKKRTLEQNSTFWGPFIDHVMGFFRHHATPLDRDEAEFFIKHHFFPRRRFLIKGKLYERVPSSADLSTVEMNEVWRIFNEYCMDRDYFEFIPEKVIEDIEEIGGYNE